MPMERALDGSATEFVTGVDYATRHFPDVVRSARVPPASGADPLSRPTIILSGLAPSAQDCRTFRRLQFILSVPAPGITVETDFAGNRLRDSRPDPDFLAKTLCSDERNHSELGGGEAGSKVA